MFQKQLQLHVSLSHLQTSGRHLISGCSAMGKIFEKASRDQNQIRASKSRGPNKSRHTFANTTSGHSRQVWRTALAALTRNQPWQTRPQFHTRCALPQGTFGSLCKRDFIVFLCSNPRRGKWLVGGGRRWPERPAGPEPVDWPASLMRRCGTRLADLEVVQLRVWALKTPTHSCVGPLADRRHMAGG